MNDPTPNPHRSIVQHPERYAPWYERQEPGLGFEFNAEIDLVLMRIAQQETFVTAPITTLPGGVVRREFVDRFPYVVVFVETQDLRKVIMIRRGSSSPALPELCAEGNDRTASSRRAPTSLRKPARQSTP